jgi:hypothetical protein
MDDPEQHSTQRNEMRDLPRPPPVAVLTGFAEQHDEVLACGAACWGGLAGQGRALVDQCPSGWANSGRSTRRYGRRYG